MKCKKCNTVLKIGEVYCTKCGTEVQIVPDYNELDDSIEYSFNNKKINTSNGNVADINDDTEDDYDENAPISPRKRPLLIIIGVIFTIVIILGVSVLFTNHQKNNDFNFQYSEAIQFLENDRPDKALEAVNKALKIDPENEEALLLLASIHTSLGDENAAIDTLFTTISYHPDSREAYIQLINIYLSKSDYYEIAQLKKEVEDEKLLTLFDGYVPKDPVFSIETGEYDDEFILELETDDDSQILYTLDGSDPVTNGTIYTSGIDILSGDTTISAVATNEYGIFSETIKETYHVVLAVPDKPTVSLKSGTYESSESITINVPIGCEAYYTWDGSTPTLNSTKYTGPFNIIEGNNVLSVVIINSNNQTSDVARFNYIYYPTTEYDEN